MPFPLTGASSIVGRPIAPRRYTCRFGAWSCAAPSRRTRPLWSSSFRLALGRRGRRLVLSTAIASLTQELLMAVKKLWSRPVGGLLAAVAAAVFGTTLWVAPLGAEPD